mgnify:CR=1 FL=1
MKGGGPKGGGRGGGKASAKRQPQRRDRTVHFTEADRSALPACSEKTPEADIFLGERARVNEVWMLSTAEELPRGECNLMVLDTACQKTTAGPKWHDNFRRLLLTRFNLEMWLTVPEHETFRFGAGHRFISEFRTGYLVQIVSCAFVLWISEPPVDTHLLASRLLLQALGLLLDLPNRRAALTALNLWNIPVILTTTRHLALDITQFDRDADSTTFPSPDTWTQPRPDEEVTSLPGDDFEFLTLDKHDRLVSVTETPTCRICDESIVDSTDLDRCDSLGVALIRRTSLSDWASSYLYDLPHHQKGTHRPAGSLSG